MAISLLRCDLPIYYITDIFISYERLFGLWVKVECIQYGHRDLQGCGKPILHQTI